MDNVLLSQSHCLQNVAHWTPNSCSRLIRLTGRVLLYRLWKTIPARTSSRPWRVSSPLSKTTSKSSLRRTLLLSQTMKIHWDKEVLKGNVKVPYESWIRAFSRASLIFRTMLAHRLSANKVISTVTVISWSSKRIYLVQWLTTCDNMQIRVPRRSL